MNEDNMIEEFLKSLESSMFIKQSDEASAYENMTTIAMDCFRNKQNPVASLSSFVESLSKIYANKVTGPSSDFIFYCWLDEMSGELRASIIEGNTSIILPFECSLEVTDNLHDFAEKAIAADANGFISFDHVTLIDENYKDTDIVWRQIVFVKSIRIEHTPDFLPKRN
jgi:hypothetical protein